MIRKSIVLRLSMLMLLMLSLQVGGVVRGQGVPAREPSTVLIDRVNPFTDVILPRIYRNIAMDVSPSVGDATLINRIRFIVALGMVDAAAPYYPTAVGMYTHLSRQPKTEWNDRIINPAMMQGAYHALVALLPERESVWREMMRDYGLVLDCVTRLAGSGACG